ncbi:17226_t:CDS:10 [Racocetra fulgida]|uniref:17226_t:CDS:1 n=1 Tax=Racocetra fulgida TaxID=60492 RepID=A0A9N8YVJ6_9GLOM|nr:17226_t:CDS:10 [Racocetra fulgida]
MEVKPETVEIDELAKKDPMEIFEFLAPKHLEKNQGFGKVIGKEPKQFQTPCYLCYPDNLERFYCRLCRTNFVDWFDIPDDPIELQLEMRGYYLIFAGKELEKDLKRQDEIEKEIAEMRKRTNERRQFIIKKNDGEKVWFFLNPKNIQRSYYQHGEEIAKIAEQVLQARHEELEKKYGFDIENCCEIRETMGCSKCYKFILLMNQKYRETWDEVEQKYQQIKRDENFLQINYSSYGSNLKYDGFFKPTEHNLTQKDILEDQQIYKNSPHFYQEAPFLTIAEDLLRLIKEDKVEKLIFLSAYDKRKFPDGDDRKYSIFYSTFEPTNAEIELIPFESETQDDNPNICKDVAKVTEELMDQIISDSVLANESKDSIIAKLEKQHLKLITIAPYYPAIEHHPEVVLVKNEVKTDKRYILCVKYNGKIYRSGREKEHVNAVKSLDSKLLKESVAATLIMQIRIQINEDKLAELEKQRF